ncbi:MAG: glutamate-1-semialdehyde 2,1-aminomutase [Candidatus Obscuribacterales bacterium]|nr:glutamate-1-semialdehyde 2,1-aminomutase [Candidatus Obscuribacterales bacterium]
MTQTAVPANRSQQAFERASKVLPGGVNSPVRSCKAVDATPIFIDRADGPYMWDIDQNRYIDYVGSWGPMILGHRHPRVLEALEDALERGTSYGAPSVHEIELAELIVHSVPSIEMVRLVSSGTEATMSAIRLARAFTKRDMIIKFDGCYHGHADSFLIKAGSGLQTLGISSSPGVPEELAKLTISLPFNDLDSLKKAFKEHGKQIAAIILEPIIGNAGLILPNDGYLEAMKKLAEENGTLVIFDEVMTGFRVALGGAQERYKIKPDLTTLGKIIGGGLPVGAYGGRRDIMEMIAPLGSVYQAGTLSGNPIAMAAGIAQLRMLQIPQSYAQLENRTQRLADGLAEIIKKTKTTAQVASVTGMICLFFSKDKVTDLESAQKCDTKKFAKFWQALRDRGIYWPPSQFEAAFISLEHSKQDIDDTLKAVEESLSQIN